MNQNYRSDINPALPVINGAYNPQNYYFDNQWWAGGTTLFNESYCLFIERIDTQPVVNALILPDNRSLTFKYNQYGEVAEVQLPTGGKMQYDYQQITALPTGVSLPAEVQTWNIPINLSGIDRALVARRTYPDGSTLEGNWTYAYTSSTAEARAFSATGTLLRNERHVFMAASRYLQPFNDSTNGTGYSLWSTGLESRSELRNASDVAISATETDWTQRASVSWWTGYTQQQPANDNRPIQQRRYLDNGMMAKTETDYDQYNNPLEVREYDFDQTLKRRTTTNYLNANNGFNYATDDSIHLLSLPVTTTIFNAAGTQIAQSTNEYDVYTNDGNHAALTDYASVSQHDSSYGVAKTTRGNPTRAGQWLNTTAAFIYAYPRYDTLGNVVSAKDRNGNVTTFSFVDDYGLGSNPGTPTQNPATPTYAFPTLVTSPPPLPDAAAHTARSEFDYSSGALTGFRDRNNVITQTIYDDPFNRPTQVKSALGITGLETHTTTYYAPQTVLGLTLARNDVLKVSDLNTVDDASIRAWTITDGFGRTTDSCVRDPQGDVKTSTLYDALGRVKQVSNPFRPSAGEVAIYTTTVYDLAGRVKSVTTPDNALVDTSYSGNTVTVTDQSGKARKSVTDGLGRLTDVYEDPNGLNYQTSYLYDVLDDLVRVTQGSQQRFFMYDSLKRLIRARNPEQSTNGSLNLTDSLTGNSAWSLGYQYDADDSLLVKTEARGVSTHFEYDALNRLTRRWYNSSSLLTATTHNSPALPSGVGTTDETRFYYDSQTLPSGAPSYSRGSAVGRLVAQVYGSGSNGDYFGYDGLGRATVKFQQTGTLNYQLGAGYNLAGAITTLTYPSGHTVTNAYDQAGRLSGLSGNLGDGGTRTYATGILYSPAGGLVKEQFGTSTPVYNKLFYNSRGQLAEIRTSTSYTGPTDTTWNRGAIINHFSEQCWGMCGGNNSTSPMTDNNGNLKKQEVYIPNDDQVSSYTMRWQQYDYDSLNRLNWAREVKDNVEQWKQQFTYDRWGNRTINAAVTYGTGINNKAFTVDTAHNQLNVPVGQSGTMTYDAAGNLTNDTYTGAGNRTYDAENKITSAWGDNNQAQLYAYDASGQRIKRTVNGVETWQVYGFGGELLAEYPANGTATSPQKEYGYRNGQLLITAEPSPTTPVNVALAANGGVASASSNYACCGFNFTPAGANNGNRSGVGWGSGEGWNDNAPGNTFPDWLQIDFNGSKTINEIDVFTGQDNWQNPSAPTESMTFTLYGLTGFDVQYWNGSAWATIPGGSVTGNNKVWRKFTFTPLTTTKIRVLTNASVDGYSRITELEAWQNAGTGGGPINWLVTDQLGTPRMILDQTGSLATMKRHDYLPFGEELFAPSSGRSSVQGYISGDGVRQHFTQKEHDNETGLDYFGARYYGSIQGRFTSIDPKMLTIKQVMNPQRWNRYAYVLNNPLALYDPDGQDDQGQGGTRVIDVFLFSALKDGSDKMTRSQREELNTLREAGRANGIEIDIYEGAANTAERASASLATTGRIVIMGVHTAQDMDGNKIGMATGNGVIARDTLLEPMAGDPNNPLEGVSRPATSAELVVAMGCDSAELSGVFQGAQNFIGVNGGADNASSTYGLNDAIIATVRTIVKANGELGQGTLNNIVTNSQRVIRNNTAQGNPDPDDRVILNPALLPPQRYERFPRRPEDED